MSQFLRVIPERRAANDRRKIVSIQRFFYKGPERRKAPYERRSQNERRDGWIRISKWSSTRFHDLKISKYLH